MKFFGGFVNLEHTYNVAWNYLNQQQYVGEFRVLKRVVTNEDNVILTIKAPRDIRDTFTVYRVASNEFDNGCRCEHDCCGHVQTHVQHVSHNKKREYKVVLYQYLNI